VVLAAVGGPNIRICPLAGPNEAMALEAQMEEWSADPQASRLVGKAGTEGGLTPWGGDDH
jgi:hypothetical protein